MNLNRWHRIALLLSAAFHAMHVLALPVIITWDGYLYIRLSEIFGTSDFSREWDFLRTPIFPILLKISFFLFGKQPLAIIALNSGLGFGGICAAAAALRRLGYGRAAIALIAMLTFWPVLAAYEHCTLTESGTFFFMALIAWTLTLPGERPWLKTAAITLAIVAGYYQRPTLLYMAPVAAVLHGAAILKARFASTAQPGLAKYKWALSHTAIVAVLPFIAAYPWSRNLDDTNRRGEILLAGLFFQAVVMPDDPRIAPVRDIYEKYFRAAERNGRMEYTGLGAEPVLQIVLSLDSRNIKLAGGEIFKSAVLNNPDRYARGVARSFLVFAGFQTPESENTLFVDRLVSGGGSQQFWVHGPLQHYQPQFVQSGSPSVISRSLKLIAPLYKRITPLAWAATLALFFFALWRRDFGLLAPSALALAFVSMHALILASIDRYAFPAAALAYANLCILGELCFAPRADVPRMQPSVLNFSADRFAFSAFAALLAVFVFMHTYYHAASGMTPSWDEAHYMTGAQHIAEGIRSGSWNEMKESFISALSMKAPLICVPAGVLMAIAGDGIVPAMLSLVLIFWLLGFASYSLFRNLFPPVFAAIAATLLITMPMITGLTHRLYVEGLYLLCAVVYLDLLIRYAWRRAWSAAALGLMLGLGVLAKLPFPALLIIPSIYVLALEIRESLRRTNYVGDLIFLALKCSGTLLTAFLVAWPWYSRNWRAAVAHAAAAANIPSCDYSYRGWLLSVVSTGPSFLIFLLAAVGLYFWIRHRKYGGFTEAQRRAWDCLLLMALSSVLANLMTINKLIRVTIGWLPAPAALAAFTALAVFQDSRRQLRTGLIAAAFSCAVMVQNTFGVLPLPALRAGDLVLLDQRYPLNLPDWFQDNHPLDRRDFRGLLKVGDEIERDAQTKFPSASIVAGLTVDNLIFNHDLMNLHSQIGKRKIVYLHNQAVLPLSADAPHYLIRSRGLERLYPGRLNNDLFPTLDADIAAGELPYEKILDFPGPDGSGLTVYRRTR